MANLPIIYVPPASRYTNQTAVIRPLIPLALRALAVMGIEWTTLKYIEDAPLLVIVATFVIAALVLAAFERRDWLRFKGKAYFPTIIASLLLVYGIITGYSYLNYETTHPVQLRPTSNEETQKATLIEWLQRAQENAR